MTLGDSQADSHGAPAVGALAHIASEDRHSGTLQPGIKLTCTTEQTEIDHWCTCRLSRYHGRMGRLGVYGLILGRLPLRVFSIGKYAPPKKMGRYQPEV